MDAPPRERSQRLWLLAILAAQACAMHIPVSMLGEWGRAHCGSDAAAKALTARVLFAMFGSNFLVVSALGVAADRVGRKPVLALAQGGNALSVGALMARAGCERRPRSPAAATTAATAAARRPRPRGPRRCSARSSRSG